MEGQSIFTARGRGGKLDLKVNILAGKMYPEKLCIAVSMFKLRFACSDDFFKAESMGSGTLQIQQVWDLVCASLKLSFRLAHTRSH